MGPVNVLILKPGQLRQLHQSVASVCLCREFLGQVEPSEVISGLSRLPQLSSIEIETFAQYPNEEKKLRVIVEGLSRINSLRKLSIGDWLSSDELAPLGHLPLERVSFSVRDFDALAQATVTQWKQVASLSVRMKSLSELDFSFLSGLSSLESLQFSSEEKSVQYEISQSLRACGLVRKKTSKGIIGDFYETGKEAPGREFVADAEPALYCYRLRAGDFLEIFDPSGATVFSGRLNPMEPSEGLWTQTGVSQSDWHRWFVANLRATLTTDFLCLPKGNSVY